MLFRSNDTATTEIYTDRYTLSLHDALPICREDRRPAGSVHIDDGGDRCDVVVALEDVRRRVIDPPGGKERHGVGEALCGQLHGGPILTPGPAVAHWDVLDKSDLLSQLRIDRGADRPPRRRIRRYVVLTSAAVLLGGGLWLGVLRAQPPVVQTVVARTAGQGAGAGSVLDASGYVTARRQATVSAKITGKVTEVLIEEGQRVREGAVLARLDDTEAQAQLGLTRAQLGRASCRERV